jgi:nucleotide-binding universal stress UspA family protein
MHSKRLWANQGMPSVYTRILVPLESDKQQEPVLDYARTLAGSTGASVLLAWLVPVLASEERFFSQIQVEPGSSGARRKEQGETFLTRAVQEFQEVGVTAEPRLVVTPLPPDQAILEICSEEDIDLIIMATLPQSAVGRFLFGSVEEKVRRRSPVPILFVNASLPEEGEV